MVHTMNRGSDRAEVRDNEALLRILHRRYAADLRGAQWSGGGVWTTMTPMTDQLLTVTPEARDKIDGVRTFNDFPEAMLRVRIVAREGIRFRYEIALEDPRDRTDSDMLVELDGLAVAVDPDSAPDLAGATIDLDPAVTGGGLRIDNPNEGWKDPVARAVQDVIDRQINPGVGSHGGMVTLVDVRDGTAFLRFGGGCQGCAAVDVTLKHGVETAIRAAVPSISAIVDATDHEAGANPYYQHGH
jgi:Fe/S biogenesis protein NfuA